MPGYGWSSVVLIQPIGQYQPQLWILPVAWAEVMRHCLTTDACPHHLQVALFCLFCLLYLNLVHIRPNFSKSSNYRSSQLSYFAPPEKVLYTRAGLGRIGIAAEVNFDELTDFAVKVDFVICQGVQITSATCRQG